MANPVNQYREESDAKRIIQIRAIIRDLPQACSDFIRSIAVTTSTLTRLAYAIDLRTFFRFLQSERVAFSDKKLTLLTDQDLEKLTQSDLTAYTEYLTYYFKSDDDSVPNKAELVPLPKIHEKPIIRLSKDELVRILSTAQSGEQMSKGQQKYQKITAKRDFALLSLFLGTGIRVSECVGMNLNDVDFENNAFVVTRKGGNQVVLYFSPEVADALADYVDERKNVETLPGHEDALFLSLQRKRITQRAVQNLVKKYAAIAAPLKTKISPHKLRSTYATNLYNETGDIYLVADVLGHSSVDTTRKHYADMTDARRRMAAEHVHLPGDPDFKAD